MDYNSKRLASFSLFCVLLFHFLHPVRLSAHWSTDVGSGAEMVKSGRLSAYNIIQYLNPILFSLFFLFAAFFSHLFLLWKQRTRNLHKNECISEKCSAFKVLFSFVPRKLLVLLLHPRWFSARCRACTKFSANKSNESELVPEHNTASVSQSTMFVL